MVSDDDEQILRTPLEKYFKDAPKFTDDDIINGKVPPGYKDDEDHAG